MDFKTLSPAYLTSLGVALCGAFLIGSSRSLIMWLGWLLLIVALGLNVMAVLLLVGKAKGEPTPELVANLDDLESSVEHRIRERTEYRREEQEEYASEAYTEDPSEMPSRVREQHEAPIQAQKENQEEETTASQPIIQALTGRLGVLPSRAHPGSRATKPHSNEH